MCNLPGPGTEPVSPALADGFLTTGPPEKSREQILEAGVELLDHMVALFFSFLKEAREGNGTPLQYSCPENPMDGGAWWAAVHGVAKSRARLSDFTFNFHFHALEKKWQPTPVFLPGESQGWGSLVGCRPWGHTESDTTEST